MTHDIDRWSVQFLSARLIEQPKSAYAEVLVLKRGTPSSRVGWQRHPEWSDFAKEQERAVGQASGAEKEWVGKKPGGQ